MNLYSVVNSVYFNLSIFFCYLMLNCLLTFFVKLFKFNSYKKLILCFKSCHDSLPLFFINYAMNHNKFCCQFLKQFIL